MITAAAIQAAAGADRDLAKLGPDWVANDHFAVRGDWSHLATNDWSDRAPAIAKWLAEQREPASEDRSVRIESKSRARYCHCDGGNVVHDDCDDCGGHRCEDCNGTGKTADVDVGQMVFSSAAGVTVVDPAYGALLDGLTVMRVGAGPAERSMLLGLDADGSPVCAVMPRLVAVRKPEAAK